MSDILDLPRIGQLYQHYKGGIYKVLFLGKQEATQADVVVYAATDTHQVWVRPLEEFAPPRFVLAPKLANAYEIPGAKEAREMAKHLLYGTRPSTPTPGA